MKEKILNNMISVINALNTVTTSGKQNLANLSGSITILEDIVTALGDYDVVEIKKEDK